MTVLAVVAVLAAVALPGLGAFSSRKEILHQADLIGAHLHHARTQAVSRGVPWRVVFTPELDRWVCFADPNRNLRHDPGEQMMGPFTLARGVAFGSRAPSGPNSTSIPADGVSFAGNRVSFSALGTCNAGSIYLRSDDRDMALRVLPASGTVLVYERSPSWRALR